MLKATLPENLSKTVYTKTLPGYAIDLQQAYQLYRSSQTNVLSLRLMNWL